MKNSNILLTGITVFLLGTAFVTDTILRGVYRKMDLDDPQKNWVPLPILPFKVLQITGGNSYRIGITKSPRFELKVLRSRRGQINSSRAGDTLKIDWTVAGRQGISMDDTPIGLMIGCPDLIYLSFSGTRNWIHGFNGDSCSIRQNANTQTTLEGSTFRRLDLQGSQTSWYDVKELQVKGSFNLNLEEESGIRLREITWGSINPLVAEKASVVFVGPAIHVCR